MKLDASKVNVIGFDADDTLWKNEMIFRNAEKEVCTLLSDYDVEHVLLKDMFSIEMQNLPTYGYGIKGFTLSMIEFALSVSQRQVKPEIIDRILDIGKSMLEEPVELISGIKDVLDRLVAYRNKKGEPYKIVVITKGDLLDQERKLDRSGLANYFHHVEIVSNKTTKDYKRSLKRMEVTPANFLMVGNSLKSDVLPLLPLGAQAVHIPFELTWAHEEAVAEEHEEYLEIQHARELLPLLTA